MDEYHDEAWHLEVEKGFSGEYLQADPRNDFPGSIGSFA